jgi:hypothetical protein
MIRIGPRQFEVPLWLWVAVPLASVIYAVYGTDVFLPRFGAPDGAFFLTVRRCATAALTGFLIADLARRARLPWYDLIVLGLASFAASSLSIDLLTAAVRETPRSITGLVISIAGSVEPGSGGALLLMVVRIVVPLCCGLILALLLTIASRYLLGLPLRAADTRREFRANLGGAYVWLAIGIVGYGAIRSVWASSGPVPRWLPFTAASLGVLAALAVQLWLAHRARRDELNPRHSLKVGALAAACAFAWFYSPGVFGQAGFRLMNNQVRPALRALHVLPTPDIAVAGYRVDVPYHDVKVFKGPAMPDGATSFVAVPLPDEYGLTSTSRNPQVHIARRDITLREMTRFFWFDSRKELGEMQAARAGKDAVVRVPLGVIAGLAFRSDEYPLVDVRLVGFDAAVATETAEQALRQFLRERLQRVSG